MSKERLQQEIKTKKRTIQYFETQLAHAANSHALAVQILEEREKAY